MVCVCMFHEFAGVTSSVQGCAGCMDEARRKGLVSKIHEAEFEVCIYKWCLCMMR